MKRITLLLLCTLLLHSLPAQNAYQFDSEVTQDWIGTQLYLVKNGTGFTPPVASRAFGYSGLALYEALASGMPDRNSLEPRLTGLSLTPPNVSTDYHWPTVANNCLALIVDSLWANASTLQKDSIHALRDRFNTLFAGEPEFSNSRTFGEAIATDVFNWSKTDGAYQAYLYNTDPAYVAPTGPGLWVPSPPAYGAALQPYWGSNRPIVADNVQPPIIPAGPPPFSTDTTSAFYAYAHQVYVTVNNLVPSQAIIADYWADGPATVTPPGHSVSILLQIMNQENENLGYSAYAFAKLALSQFDAFIACWETKFTYNLIRPVSYINAYIDSSWLPVVTTPPFPEYTSGHSTQSGAMTSIMNDLYGTQYAFTDSTHGSNYGGPRTFLCFDEAAYEAATSRMFGGIHYEFSDVFAISLGKLVGDNINALFESVTVGNPDLQTQQSASVRFYPNPTTNYALISTTGFQPGKIEVYNLSGQLLESSANTSVLDLSGYPAGQYVLQIFDKKNGLVSTERIIRQ